MSKQYLVLDRDVLALPGVSVRSLLNFWKPFLSDHYLISRKISRNFFAKKAHDVDRRSRDSKKIEKVDTFLSEANPENGPIESWPYLLVKNTKFSRKRPIQLSHFQKFLARRSRSAVIGRCGVFRACSNWKKVSRLANFPGNFQKRGFANTTLFPKEFPETPGKANSCAGRTFP